MCIPLADYQKERAAFDALLDPDCKKRILLFHGESGSGKTTLLSSCRDSVKQGAQISYVNIDLKGTAVSVAEILSRTSDRLPVAQLPNLRQKVAELEGLPAVDLDNVKLTGFGNKLNVTLQVNDPNDRESRRLSLTDALFADLRAFTQPVLFILDTYQDATTEVRDWISGPFLARLDAAIQVRVVIAGQNVPDENNLDWGHCCSSHRLKGVPDAKHWVPVVDAMKLRVPASDTLSWLVGVCGLLKGRPSEIMQHLRAEQERSLRDE